MSPSTDWFLRWFHIMAGIMWIGLLYYFNFVNVAAVKEATAAGEAGPISKYVVPRALSSFVGAPSSRGSSARRCSAATPRPTA